MIDQETLSGFAPLLGCNPHALILGTMPSVASLQARQYYGHPRNAFWPIMAKIVGFSSDLDYPQRVAAITDAGFAVWDVLAHCQRRGSLDSAIETDSIICNDFAALFSQNSTIKHVFFNGGKAEQLYRRHASPELASAHAAIPTLQLPSTSPANARLRLADKLAIWQPALDASLV